MARMTRAHVTVALSGDGGDESFAGYERYKAYRIAQVYRRLPRVLRRGLLRRLARALPHSDRRGLYRKGKRFFSQIGESPEADYLRLICFFDPERKAQLLTEAFHRGITESAEAFLDRVYAGTEAEAAELDRLIGVDLGTYLPDDINVKVDIAAMAHSLEVRSPFLDQELVEFAARLPARLKLRGLAQKYLLKRAFPDLLPSSIRDRGKMGFGVPLDYWFRGELAELLKDTLLSERFRQRGLFRPAAVERLIAEHERRRADHQYRLWALLFLEQWFRAFIDAPSR